MKMHIFSPQGEQALAATMALWPLLAFDFDGTLAPIVALPDMARMPPGVVIRLRQLARYLPVAIVTGREVADVSKRLGFTPKYIVGSHGAESDLLPPLPMWVSAMESAREWLQPFREELQAMGVHVEDKRSSIALHYRMARDRELARRRLEEILKTAGPALHVFGGKLVFNIVAARAPDKADAVHAVVAREGAASAVFIGDDVNDEPVFQRAPAHWLTIKVGRTSAHSRARFYLDSPREMAMLLDRMLAQPGPG